MQRQQIWKVVPRALFAEPAKLASYLRDMRRVVHALQAPERRFTGGLFRFFANKARDGFAPPAVCRVENAR
jgi:hypothetical protein